VSKLGNHALLWFTLLLRRFELILLDQIHRQNTQPEPWRNKAPTPGEVHVDKAERPRWDREKRKLLLGDVPVRTFSRHAPAQFGVLDAFQKGNWPASIPNPLKHFSLKDTVDALNGALVSSRLRFYRRDNDKVVEWALTPV
jgi:hypothetical protein